MNVPELNRATRRLVLKVASDAIIDQGPNIELAANVVRSLSKSSDIDSTKEYEYGEELDLEETD